MSTSAPPPQPDDAIGSSSRGSSRDAIRLEARARRAALSEAEASDSSIGCARLLVALDALATPGTIATYLPTDGELDPNLAMPELRDRGWTVTLPVVGDGRTMRFVRWDATAEMAPNRFGIDEPVGPHTVVRPEDLDAVLVPCVALDLHGNRLGFGAGFYDRAFAEPGPDATTPPRRAVLVGVVHEVQLFERIDPDPWDDPMDLVLTGSQVIAPQR